LKQNGETRVRKWIRIKMRKTWKELTQEMNEAREENNINKWWNVIKQERDQEARSAEWIWENKEQEIKKKNLNNEVDTNYWKAIWLYKFEPQEW
jgi:hypothetical protein